MARTPQLLHELLDATADSSPTSVALSTRDHSLTYAELAAASDVMAGLLQRQGLCRGDRVVITAANGIGIAVLVYAASRLGAVYSVLHEQVRGTPLEHVLDDCEPALLISDDRDVQRSAAAHGVPFLELDDLLRVVLAADIDAPLVHTGQGVLSVDPVSLIYTSGTTSLPKAVVSTHQQVVFAASAIQERLQYRSDDVVYCPLPLSFDYGLYQVYLAALGGSRLHLGTEAEAGPPLLRSLETAGATVLPAVPSVADRLAWLLRRSDGALGQLRLVTNTGAALSESTMSALRAALPGLKIQVMYGLTECKRTAIMPPDGDLERPGSCGLPLPGTEVFVIDDEDNRLPPGEIGQLVVRGPNVMAGYWNRPELTAERFPRAQGLFAELRTGDYGWQDKDGYLYFCGRRDDLYKERGFRLSTTEVEAAATRVDGVTSAAVLPPQGKQSALLAVVADISADEVRAAMRDHIEPFKIPRRCVRLESLPTNGNGKVDRKKLAALLEQTPATSPLTEALQARLSH
ncbi:class I adenylate-forming enzyme family protein [Streptomyces sp. NPDC054888]